MSISKVGLLSEANKAAPLEGIGTELNRCKNVVKCVYDFAVSGGVQGDIGLLDDEGNPAVVPANAIITRVLVDVLTQPTSAGAATVAIKAVGAGDLLGATAKASLTVGLHDGIPVNTAATSVKATVQEQIKATIGTADLTAGKINVFVEYNLSG